MRSLDICLKSRDYWWFPSSFMPREKSRHFWDFLHQKSNGANRENDLRQEFNPPTSPFPIDPRPCLFKMARSLGRQKKAGDLADEKGSFIENRFLRDWGVDLKKLAVSIFRASETGYPGEKTRLKSVTHSLFWFWCREFYLIEISARLFIRPLFLSELTIFILHSHTWLRVF